jgi:hypothetical protein
MTFLASAPSTLKASRSSLTIEIDRSEYPKAHYDRGLDHRLTDYLVVFIASNIARYRPALWRAIVDGSGEIESRFNQRVKTAYVNYAKGVRSYLNDFWLILATWKSR